MEPVQNVQKDNFLKVFQFPRLKKLDWYIILNLKK